MHKDNAVILIATRPDSKRLPGKAFKNIGGVPAIEHILKRIQSSGIRTVLCVPDDSDAYNHLLAHYEIEVFKGDPGSPLHRMADFMSLYGGGVQWVIRITHDDILIDVETMLGLLDRCQNEPGCGYGVSPEIVEGAGVEVFRTENLLQAAEATKTPTEFVSYFVKAGPFTGQLKFRPRESVCRKYRLTMDYEEDFAVLNIIARALGVGATLDSIVDYLDLNPHILNINRLPRISIYTCAYNMEKYIWTTMNSVMNATCNNPDIEYIVVDDASTDGTLAEIAKFKWHASPLRIIANETNEGLASSSNKALAVARGEYVMRVDADDWLYPGMIDECVELLENTGAGIVYTDYFETDESGTIRKGTVQGNANHHAGCALMAKKMINEIRFADGLRHWDGLDLYKRIMDHRFDVVYFNRPLWFYRRRNDSLSAKMTPERSQALSEVNQK